MRFESPFEALIRQCRHMALILMIIFYPNSMFYYYLESLALMPP